MPERVRVSYHIFTAALFAFDAMMRIAPITTPGITDRYLADKIYGFPAGGVTLMPTTGPAEADPVKYASFR